MNRKRLLLGLVVLLAAGVARADNAGHRTKVEDRGVETPALTEYQTVRMVERLGGICHRTDDSPEKPVTLVYLAGTKVTDGDVKKLACLSHLHHLFLGHTSVTDTGLKELAGLQQLRFLDLQFTPITDAGLEHLAGLTQLRHLHLQGTKVTGMGVGRLKQALPHCQITG